MEVSLHCRNLLTQCGVQTICLCKHGKLPEDRELLCIALSRYLQDSKDQLKRYSRWPIDKLEDLALRRKIPLVKQLPKPDKRHKLAKLLEDSDHQYPFRLLELPSEVRLEIYKMVLLSGQDQNVRIFNQVRQPPLPRVCKKKYPAKQFNSTMVKHGSRSRYNSTAHSQCLHHN